MDSLQPPEGDNLANTLILDFWSLQLQENKFPLFSATWFVVICLRELIYMEYIFPSFYFQLICIFDAKVNLL